MDDGKRVLVWPENKQSVAVFLSMRTQWFQSMGGPTGLNYASLNELWRRLKVPESDRDAIFQDLLVLEDAAMSEMHKPKD
jgi:hypothetical protein